MSAQQYDWLTLEGDEEIVWSGEPELLGYAWAFLLGIVLIPFFGIGLVIIVSTYLTLKNTAYVITTDSVFKKTGILSRKITDIGHENIQDTGYRQGVAGRYFGFGTVQISTAGGSGVEMSLENVGDPLAVQSQLDRAAKTGRAKGDRTEQAQSETVRIDGETVEELIEEMRATRTALESIDRQLRDE